MNTFGGAQHNRSSTGLDQVRTGLAHRYLYTVGGTSIVKYDLRGASSAYDCGPGAHVGEAVFVPASGARAEDEGWLLSIVSGDFGQLGKDVAAYLERENWGKRGRGASVVGTVKNTHQYVSDAY